MPSPEATGPEATGPGAAGPAVATPAPGAVGSIAVDHDGDVCRLSGTIDFTTARETLEAVSPLLESGRIRQVDFGGVARSNSAGLALMVEWLGVARRAGYPLEFVAVPDGLRQLAGVCQVDDLVL